MCPLLVQDTPRGELLVPHRYWPQDEHCQNLNIWTTTLDEKAQKPVVVWLHGGGYFAGSSIEQAAYDGFNMCFTSDAAHYKSFVEKTVSLRNLHQIGNFHTAAGLSMFNKLELSEQEMEEIIGKVYGEHTKELMQEFARAYDHIQADTLYNNRSPMARFLHSRLLPQSPD